MFFTYLAHAKGEFDIVMGQHSQEKELECVANARKEYTGLCCYDQICEGNDSAFNEKKKISVNKGKYK